jgi:hypothetical protein
MISLSDQSLIPNPVKARKSLEPQIDDTQDDRSDSNIADLQVAQPIVLPLPAERSSNTQHDHRASNLSVYSASIYSDDSLAISDDGGTRHHESHSSSESQTKTPDAKDTSKDVLTEKQTKPVESNKFTASPGLLTSGPPVLAEVTSVNFTSDSPTHQTVTFFLEGSLSKANHSTSPPTRRESQCKSDANESGSDAGSALVSSGSSDDIPDAKKVRCDSIFRCSAFDNSIYRLLPTL